MGDGLKAIISVATALTGVAIIAVLVSKKSATTDVITSLGNAYASALREAVSPITS